MKALVAFLLAMMIGVYGAKAESLTGNPSETETGVLPIYVKEESARIFKEGDRIKSEATRLRSEGARLNEEGRELRAKASHLDALWKVAERAQHLREFRGYNRSQIRMRADSVKLDYGASDLRKGAQVLDHEAIKLWKLSAAVDPAAMKALLDRLRNCCNTQVSVEILRAKIMQMAQAEHVRYTPQ